MIRIFLVDDHQVVREGLRALINAQTSYMVVGESSGDENVIKQIEQLKPDIVLLDLMMPGVSGLTLAKQITEQYNRTKVIILSMHANEGYVVQAIRNGASGYIVKDAGMAEVIKAIQWVMDGKQYFSAPFSEEMLQTYIDRTQSTPLDSYDTLTKREQEVMRLAAEGRTNGEIAQQLVISPRTVETHRANIMHKLGLRSQVELIRYAISRGIISLDA
jgi:two-component system, NarL family, response regulator NreC